MHVMDASPAMFSYFTIAEELAKRSFTVHFNGLHIGTDDIAEVQMVVLDNSRVWVELTLTVMPVGGRTTPCGHQPARGRGRHRLC